jgi:hypothetical protein
MKKYLLFVFVSIFFIGSYCLSAEEVDIKTENIEKIGYEKLTEAELKKFIEVAPMVGEEIEKSGKKFESAESPEQFNAWLGQFYTLNQGIAGLDAKLKAKGTSWEDFWTTMAKTWMAMIAIQFDEKMVEMEEGLEEMKASLNNPNLPPEHKQMLEQSIKSMEALKTTYENVPQENKDVVKKHEDELKELFEMEEED